MEQDLDLLNETTQFAIQRIQRKTIFNMPHHHFHHHYEIFYLISGKRCYFINDRPYQIDVGDLVLIKKYDLHHTIDVDSSGYERILINFTQQFFSDIEEVFKDIKISNCFLNPIIRLSSDKRKEVETIFNKVEKEMSLKNEYSPIHIKILLCELFIIVLKENKHNVDFAYLNDTHEKISETVRYINSNYSSKLTLEKISKECFISKYYFCHNFKSVMGISFIKYLNLIRIREAEKLLRTTNFKIFQIMEKTGFESQTHFGRIFKQYSGMAPLQYRKKVKN